MGLSEQLTEYVHAAFSGIWIQTAEPDEAEPRADSTGPSAEVAPGHLGHRQWHAPPGDPGRQRRMPAAGDPLAAIRTLPTLAEGDGHAPLLVLPHFHRFLNSPEIIQTVFNQLIAGKQQRTFLVVLAPVVQIPVELEKLFVVLTHDLPDRNQLATIGRELTTDDPHALPAGDGLRRVLDAAAGLTRYECEGAFALSIARHSVIRPDVVTELKAQALRKNNLLTLHRGRESFAELGGLGALKDFCRRALTPKANPIVRPRGVLLLGVAGTGKSAFAKAWAPRPAGPPCCSTWAPVRLPGRRDRSQCPSGVADCRRDEPLRDLCRRDRESPGRCRRHWRQRRRFASLRAPC